jgi:large subunit ribosomal protein L6
MSRIGKDPINIPDKVEAKLVNNIIYVSGPKGKLEYTFTNKLKIEISDKNIIVSRMNDSKEQKSLHGTTRQMINNLIIGVTIGFKKELKIIGVGYQAMMQGKRLQFQLGFSHDIIFELPDGINIIANKTELTIEGIDKQLVGSVAAKIRSFRKPEPYKGKGIRYKDEYVRSKQGKTVGSK